MVNLDFYITEQTYDKLMELKETEGKEDLTGNQYARQLLEEAIYIKKLKLKNHSK